MSAVFRKALFWLLMLALPLHGAAAVAMGLASAASAHAASVQAARMVQVDAAAHPVAPDCADMPDCGFSTHASLKCGLSSSCGVVAAPPASPPHAFSMPLARRLHLAAPVQHAIAFCTGAPERPPRPIA